MAKQEQQASSSGGDGDGKGGGGAWMALLGALIAVLLMGAAGGGLWYFQGRADAAAPADAEVEVEAPKPEPEYVALEPTFTVNLADKPTLRFLQVEIELITHEKAVVTAIERHMPRIRNNLLLLFGTKRYEELTSRKGKETLQQAALAEVRSALEAQGAPAEVEDILFTSFVMQ